MRCCREIRGIVQIRADIQGAVAMQGSLLGKVETEQNLGGSLNYATGVSPPMYEGAYEVTPLPFEAQTLRAKNKLMGDDVVVLEIPYFETSNVSGTTVYIGGE